MTEYETTVVIRANVGGDAVETALDRMRDVIKARNGKLLAITHWGKKKLAYEIEKQARGLYVHAHYLGGNDVVAEIERNFRINDQVLRFLTIKLNDRVIADEREEQAYVRPEYDLDDGDADAEGEEGAEAQGGEGREGRDGRDGRDSRDGREGRDGRDGRDGREGRDGRDGREGRDSREVRDGREARESREGGERRAEGSNEASNEAGGEAGAQASVRAAARGGA